MEAELLGALDAASKSEMNALLRREEELAGVLRPASDPHPAAKILEGVLRGDQPDQEWGSVRCNKPELPFVRVSPTGITRAVALVGTIYHMAELRGWGWQTGSSRGWGTASLEVAGERFPLRIEETARRVPHKVTPEERAERERRARTPAAWELHLPMQPRWDFVATNDFMIRERSRQLFKDRKNSPVESRIGDLPRRLIQIAFSERAKSRVWAAREAELKRIQLRQQRRAELRELRAGFADRLVKLSEAWEDAERLRRFIAAAEGTLKGGPVKAGQQWLAEARTVADRLDPLMRLPSIVEADRRALDELAELESDDGAVQSRD